MVNPTPLVLYPGVAIGALVGVAFATRCELRGLHFPDLCSHRGMCTWSNNITARSEGSSRNDSNNNVLSSRAKSEAFFSSVLISQKFLLRTDGTSGVLFPEPGSSGNTKAENREFRRPDESDLKLLRKTDLACGSCINQAWYRLVVLLVFDCKVEQHYDHIWLWKRLHQCRKVSLPFGYCMSPKAKKGKFALNSDTLNWNLGCVHYYIAYTGAASCIHSPLVERSPAKAIFVFNHQ